jgi:hypothetical protein
VDSGTAGERLRACVTGSQFAQRLVGIELEGRPCDIHKQCGDSGKKGVVGPEL